MAIYDAGVITLGRRKKVLFAAGNQQEARCLIPIARCLTEMGGEAIGIEFVTFDDIFQQNVEGVLTGLPHFAFHSEMPFRRPFYFTSMWQRLNFLLRHRRRLLAVAEQCDAFVCGFGSLPQRVIAGAAYRQGKPTFGIMNAYVSKAIVDEPWNRLLIRLHQWVPALSDVLPGGIFGSTVVFRHLFVMGELMRDTLLQIGVSSRVHAVGVPIFSYLFESSPPPPRLGGDPFNVLFLTGAFDWHGQARRQRAQSSMVRGLAELMEQMGAEFSLSVKIHPRDDPAAYQMLSGYSRTSLATGTMEECLRSSDVVLAVVSTGLLETVSFGRVAAFLISEYGGDDFIQRFTAELDFLPTIRSLAELEMFLRELRDAERYAQVLQLERRGIDRCIAPTTPQSARLITEVILTELSAS